VLLTTTLMAASDECGVDLVQVKIIDEGKEQHPLVNFYFKTYRDVILPGILILFGFVVLVLLLWTDSF
jgi:hypothetical protein